MTTIGFIGLGNMGRPMVANLIKAGHEVRSFDILADARNRAEELGATIAINAAEAVLECDVAITMLPAGQDVRDVYIDHIIDHVQVGTLLIDSSTIDVETAREVIRKADERGLMMIDAPVSGGIVGAEAGSLTFMCGGAKEAFDKAKPILETMGKNIFHAGDSGAGQAVKACNNLMLAIQMISVCEGFSLAKKLDLDVQRLFDIVSTATSQCWSLTSYCPVPGPVSTSPANRDYAAGFTVAMMLKDLKIAQEAAKLSGAHIPLGTLATEIYETFAEDGGDRLDFSAIYRQIGGS